MSADEQKKAAGYAAAELAENGMVVGLGTGSTAAWFVRALAERRLDIRCVPTSEATAELARSLGLTVIALEDVDEVDLTVDGADEIGPDLALIKGAGAALLREKLVWEASRRCVVIAEAAKEVQALGAMPLPIEVVAFGHKTTARRIARVLEPFCPGAVPCLRVKDGAPVRTDGGNLIYDATCGRIEDPAALGRTLKSLTGVVDHGLFLDLADLALVGRPEGVVRLER